MPAAEVAGFRLCCGSVTDHNICVRIRMPEIVVEDASSAAADITNAALRSFDECPDPRLREIMRSLVHHLHAFATEVHLSEAEWAAAIAVLTATGSITDARRQEFILWSDALGMSMLVDALAHARGA